MGFSAEEILKKQAPEAVAPEYTIDESLKTVKSVKRGQTVTVYTYKYEYQVKNLQKPYTGVVTKVYEKYESGDYRTKVDVRQNNQTRTYNIDSENVIFKLVTDRPEFDESKIPSSIDSFKKTANKESYYVVKFDIDQRDADWITVSSRQNGEPSVRELIKLAILEHYDDLSAYDGAWFNLGPLQDFLDNVYLDGFFYEPCNRFKINGISITGYDAEKDMFYDLPIPSLKDLGITNIDEAYEHYFPTESDE